MKNLSAVLVLCLLHAGCASGRELPAIPATHPASAMAPEAPLLERTGGPHRSVVEPASPNQEQHAPNQIPKAAERGG